MKQLQLLAFKEVIPVLEKENVFYMYWPEEWINLLKVPNEQWKLKQKLSGLTERIFIMFSDVLFIQNDAKALGGKKPWIVAKRPLSKDQFEYVCKAWLQVIDENRDIMTEFMGEVKWHSGTIKEVFSEDDNAKYRWVPAVVADQLCKEPFHLSISTEFSKKVSFYRIQSGKAFEAMSEPIRRTNRQDYFSYVYRLELVTRGIENEPLLKVSFGIRRFYQKRVKTEKLIRNNQKVSVFVSIPNPFSNDEKRSFAKLKIEQGKLGVKWERGSFGLLDDLVLGELPSLNEIVKDPKAYVEGENVKVLVVYNESTFSIDGTKVERGMGLPEKEELLNVFLRTFPSFEILSPCEEVKTAFNSDILPLYSPEGIEELKVEVYSNEMLEKVKEVLVKKELAKTGEEKDSFVLHTKPEVKLKMVECSPEGIVQDLNYERYKYKAAARHVQAIVQKVEKCDKDTLSLVEIDPYTDSNIDPKQAVREGLARTGRISQFIHPFHNDKAGEERIYKALLDLLADKGFRKHNWDKFHYTGIILSLSLIKVKREKGTEYLPVLTKIHGENVEYKLYGEEQWKSIDESILDVYNHRLFLKYGEREKLKQFIVNELLHILNRTEDTVCFIINATLRYGWIYGVANPNIKLKELPNFDDMLATFSNLRVIRINQTEDVPRFFIHTKNSYINKSSGLYRDPTGIYYSVGLRPSTMKGVPNGAKKLNIPTKMLGQQRSVEIIVSGAEEAERDELACMVDYLRRMVVTFEKHTQLPLPMHMVRSIKKYISPDEAFVQQDELEDDIILEEDGQVAAVLV
ncbi:pPIWI_RE module domain-containing protein [Bacillus manliponensis]|uniref:pPIWI_RE module domain-containing protein n=1 Tax=Bacillus manliponensis TaxID=574376 RepID=UPI0035147DC7